MMEEPVRRGPKLGPRLKTLLVPTGSFRRGATMADLVDAGFTRDLKPYLDDGTIVMDDQGIYRLVETEPAEAPAAGAMVEIPIADIEIGRSRFRKDLGSLDELVDSIREVGLLQPIGITNQKELVFGQRRIEAFKRLGRATIPARIVSVTSIAKGEHDENELRKEFTASERVAILQAIGRKPEGGQSADCQDLVSRDDAAKQAGFWNRETARQATAVVDHGTSELVDAMDKGEVSIDAAAVIAKQPAEVQSNIVKLPKPARKAAVRISAARHQ